MATQRKKRKTIPMPYIMVGGHPMEIYSVEESGGRSPWPLMIRMKYRGWYGMAFAYKPKRKTDPLELLIARNRR
jgi:hypothetical protein